MDQEQHKYRCLVRQLLKYRAEWGLEKYRCYINGPKAAWMKKLTEEDFVDQWKKGNRGKSGDWR